MDTFIDVNAFVVLALVLFGGASCAHPVDMEIAELAW
jgi:hypothetical protein